MSLVERIFYFHQEVLRGNFPNARTIAHHFEVSQATAKRDINYLRDRLLAPLAYDPVRFGYRYDDSFNFPFSDSPRLVFLLAMLNRLARESGLQDIPEVKQLEQRLGGIIAPDYGNVVDALYCDRIELEEIDHRIFNTVIDGLAAGRFLEFSYRSGDGEQSTRTVAPLQLVNYQGSWYLLGYCRLREANRLFHLARIVRATTLAEQVPAALTIDLSELTGSFGIFRGRPRFRAELLFTGRAAEMVSRQRWHRDQEMEWCAEGLRVCLPVSDHREILMKILQYGSMARVVGPPELVTTITEEIDTMRALYQDGSSTCK